MTRSLRSIAASALIVADPSLLSLAEASTVQDDLGVSTSRVSGFSRLESSIELTTTPTDLAEAAEQLFAPNPDHMSHTGTKAIRTGLTIKRLIAFRLALLRRYLMPLVSTRRQQPVPNARPRYHPYNHQTRALFPRVQQRTSHMAPGSVQTLAEGITNNTGYTEANGSEAGPLRMHQTASHPTAARIGFTSSNSNIYNDNYGLAGPLPQPIVHQVAPQPAETLEDSFDSTFDPHISLDNATDGYSPRQLEW